MEQDQGRFLPSLNFTFENIIAHVLNKVLQCTTLFVQSGGGAVWSCDCHVTYYREHHCPCLEYSAPLLYQRGEGTVQSRDCHVTYYGEHHCPYCVLSKVLLCSTLLCREGKEQFNHVTVILVMLQYVIRNLEIKLDLDLFSRSSLRTCKLQLKCLTLYQPWEPMEPVKRSVRVWRFSSSSSSLSLLPPSSLPPPSILGHLTGQRATGHGSLPLQSERERILWTVHRWRWVCGHVTVMWL